MNKTLIVGGIVAVAIIISIAYGASMNPGGSEQKRSDSEVWSIRLSGYQDWVDHGYSKHSYGDYIAGGGCLDPRWMDQVKLGKGKFNICDSGLWLDPGTYSFSFVPMGDSPSKMIIRIAYDSPSVFTHKPVGGIFEEEFVLKKTLIDTGISKYYTWEYLGDNVFTISETKPNGQPRQDMYYNIFIEPWDSMDMEGSVSISLSKLDRSI